MRTPNNRSLDGFTLVEMLVSIGVLVLLVVFITQLFNSTAATITGQQRRTDADTEARIVFDRLSTDLGRMIRRRDLDFYGKDTTFGTDRPMTGNDQLAFYSEVSGFYSSSLPSPTAPPTRNNRSPSSLVAYTLSNDLIGRPQLVRLAKGLTWEADKGWSNIAYLPMKILDQWPNLFTVSGSAYSGMQDSDFTVVSESVVRFEYCYLLQPTKIAAAGFSTIPYNQSITGHSERDFYQDIASLVVAIAILDPSSRVIVSNYSQLTSQGLFADASTTDISANWETKILQPGFASTAQIPLKAASAVRVYQRRFNFTNTTSE